jgi:hypothetical protein
MRHRSWIDFLAGALVAGLFALVQYGLMARQVPGLIAAGRLTLDGGGLWLRDWVGPSLTVPTITLAVGLVVGWLAAQAPDRPTQAGARAGAAAGFGALLAVTLVCTGLLAWLGGNPAVQEVVRLSEPHPEARLAPEAIPWLSAGIGALLGLTVGAQSFALALFGGLIADLLGGRRDQPTQRPAQ